jgi:hypothetical protein
VPARVLLALALALLLPQSGRAQPGPADAAEREWSRTLGTLGTLHALPLFELALLEYRQTQGLSRELASKRGVLAHAPLASPASSFLPESEPDVLLSSAWLDVGEQPFVLFVPPLDGRWYGVELRDAFGEVAAALSPRAVGGVGGWHLVAHASWQGERPPGLMEAELRVDAPLAWLLVRVAATPARAARLEEQIQRELRLLPLEIYARSPKAAAFAAPRAQPGLEPAPRATPEMRGTLDVLRVVNERLRRLAPAPGEAALLALFDRAGFGPGVTWDPARLPAAQLDGLRDAVRGAERLLRDAEPAPIGWSALPSPFAARPGDPLARAVRARFAPGASPPAEVALARTRHDADGRALDGRNAYRIRFAKDALPPAKAFWSLAAYDVESRRLLELRAERAALSSLDGGLASAPDGSVEVLVSSEAPEDGPAHVHWLPVRPGPFVLVARLYEPLPAALDGRYVMPPVVPLDE